MSTSLEAEILDILRTHLSPIVAKSILSVSTSRAGLDMGDLRSSDHPKLMSELTKGVKLYMDEAEQQRDCIERLSALLGVEKLTKAIDTRPISIEIKEEADIVTARGRGTQVCAELGFPKVVQVKVATAISELARNIVQYAGEGEITIVSLANGIEVVARDQGPGIDHIDTVLNGDYSSRTGMGMGLVGTKKLMDEFDIQTKRGLGTTVKIRKFL